jgi:hypothetical protein
MAEGGVFQPHPHFEGAGVSLTSDDTADSWSASAATLESYLVQRASENAHIAPTATGKTDENGVVTFSGLEAGLYLLVGDQTTIGKNVYTPTATLVSLPSLDGIGAWRSDPSIYVKNSSQELVTPLDSVPTYTDLTVIKIWKDEGHENERPASVTVTLYRNEEEYDTVTLSAENNWRYVWQIPDDTSRWHLVEKNIPENYTVTSAQDGNIFVVVNTFHEEPPDLPELPDIPDEPSGQKLPQTGQLWWPVSILAVGGLITLLAGFGLRRKGDSHEEK